MLGPDGAISIHRRERWIHQGCTKDAGRDEDVSGRACRSRPRPVHPKRSGLFSFAPAQLQQPEFCAASSYSGGGSSRWCAASAEPNCRAISYQRRASPMSGATPRTRIWVSTFGS